jgi:transglutaminase-like putative cysteine protease
VSRLVGNLGQWFEGSSPGAETASAGDAASERVELRITQAEVATWPLLLPRKTAAVTANAAVLRVDRFGLVRRPHGLPVRQYGAVLPAPAANPSAAPRELSLEERAESLSLPPAVDPRVVALARRLAPPSDAPRARLDAIVRHLQTGYRYSLSPGPFRPDGDPLAEFLFEKKQAYCEYFASAAVVLLRLQGVPARYVKGLSVGPQNDVGGGLHVVRESDAHAWVEAWIPAEGWVEADPTPPGQFEAARGTPDRLERWLEHARAGLSAAWRRFTDGGPLAFLRWLGGEVVSLATRAVREPFFWLAALALALGPTLLRRLRRLRRPRVSGARGDDAFVPADLRDLVRDLERRWATHGRPRPPARGRLEHARALRSEDDSAPDAPSLPTPLVAASRRVVDAYYRARFGGEPLAPDEVQRLRESLRS